VTIGENIHDTSVSPPGRQASRRDRRLARKASAFSLRDVPLGAQICAVLLLLMVLAAIFAPLLTPYEPNQAILQDRLLPPAWVNGGSSAHFLGTDELGRDLLTRLVYGGRVSLSVAGLAIVFGGAVGALVGIASAAFGGVVDSILMRVVDIVMALPALLLALLLAVAIGPSYLNIVLVISLFLWPKIARQVRGDALAIKQQDYVVYAHAIGTRRWPTMMRHYLPNVTPSLLVITTLEVGSVILMEATLGFLGVGVPPPTASWGQMIARGSALLATGWWVALFPGFMIIIAVLSFNTLGDWLRDHLDPRLKQR
jgi:peptide/nickel transport system permease protein